jgi:hypothetical protein
VRGTERVLACFYSRRVGSGRVAIDMKTADGRDGDGWSVKASDTDRFLQQGPAGGASKARPPGNSLQLVASSTYYSYLPPSLPFVRCCCCYYSLSLSIYIYI